MFDTQIACFDLSADDNTNMKKISIMIIIIIIYYESEGRIEQSVPRLAVWHHMACRVMKKDDPEGRILLSYPHMNNRFFSCSALILFIYLFSSKLPRIP